MHTVVAPSNPKQASIGTLPPPISPLCRAAHSPPESDRPFPDRLNPRLRHLGPGLNRLCPRLDGRPDTIHQTASGVYNPVRLCARTQAHGWAAGGGEEEFREVLLWVYSYRIAA